MQVRETNVYNSLIIDTIREMVGLAEEGDFTAKQELNGVTVLVNGDSNVELIFRDQQRAQSGYIDGDIGPYPNPVLTDEAGWQKFKDVNTDGYGGAVVTYSERWARLMQVEMANGKKLENVADAASHEADLEGITGFMYGCAVSTLAACWKYGDQLRRWHNIKTQIGNEGEKANESGGVLNPALLSIG